MGQPTLRIMLPSIHQKEWLQLLTDTEEPAVYSYLLQNKIRSLRKRLKLRMLTLQEAVSELYAHCEANYPLYQTDIFKLFYREKIKPLR